MEHWAQKCDGAGYDPSAFVAVCRERDRLKAKLQSVIATLHDVESEYYEMKAAFDGAKRAMAALNEKLVQITSERDGLNELLDASAAGQETMQKHLQAVVAERNALLDYAKTSIDSCEICFHGAEEPPDCDVECQDCKLDCCCRDCRGGSKFEFVGVKKEETT